jgi:hypothetical protein
MYTLFLSAFLGIAVMLAFGLTGVSNWGWSACWGAIAFVGGQGLAGFLFQKKVKAAMKAVQDILLDGQKRLQAKVNQWRYRPPGSIREAQEEIERDQKALVNKALETSKDMERFIPWVPLMKRQIATMRLQLYWTIKDFKRVDELLPQAILLDPMMVAIKLARMQMLGQTEGMEKLFKKATLRLRYGQGALLYGLWSWILVQRKDIDGAYKILVQACEKMEDATIKANRDALANNRLTSFTNAGFGDQWYALHLETPKIKMQRPSHFAQRPF